MAPDSFQLILLTKHMCLNIFLISQTVRHYCLLSPIHPSSHPAIQPSSHPSIDSSIIYPRFLHVQGYFGWGGGWGCWSPYD